MCRLVARRVDAHVSGTQGGQIYGTYESERLLSERKALESGAVPSMNVIVGDLRVARGDTQGTNADAPPVHAAG